MLKPNAFIVPSAPVLRKEPPIGEQWIYEVKFDGWRSDEALHEFIGVSLTFQCFFGYLKRAIQRSQLLRDEASLPELERLYRRPSLWHRRQG